MGFLGGGRNDIISRFIRYLNMIFIDEFDDFTLIRIFINIIDWYFGKGFDVLFVRNGKVIEYCIRDYFFDIGILIFFFFVSFFKG